MKAIGYLDAEIFCQLIEAETFAIIEYNYILIFELNPNFNLL
jgi:hypothetical protein